MKKLLLGLSIIALIIACTHIGQYVAVPDISYKVPEIEEIGSSNEALARLEELKGLHTDKASQWWLIYRQAKLLEKAQDPGGACVQYTALARESYFPLRDVAKIRSEKNCEATSLEKITPPQKKYSKKPWLMSLGQENYILQVTQLPASEEKLNHYLDLVELPLEKDERITYLKELLQLGEHYPLPEDLFSLYQEKLYELAPSLRPNPTKPEHLFAAALDYRRQRKFKEAEAIYLNLLQGAPEEMDQHYKAHNELRMTYKIQNKKNLYIKTTSDMAEWAERWYKKKPTSQNQRMYFDSHLTLTRAVWTQGQTDRAVAILRKLEKALNNRYPLSEVYWLQARIREERGRFEDALYWLKKAREDRFGLPLSLKSYVLWHQSWNLRKLGRTRDSLEILEQLVKETKDPYEAHRYNYWLARNYQDLKQTEKAQKQFAELSRADGLGYYGMLAFRELKSGIPALNVSRRLAAEEIQQQDGFLTANDRTYLDWLLSLDETQVALAYLEELTAKLESEGQAAEAWTEVLTYYARAGQYLPLFKQIGRVDSRIKDEILAARPDYLFPQPYSEYTQAVSEKTKVSSELIYSIMRQESAFNAKARSHADAFGLLQLLPSVAESVARRHGLSYSSFEDLYEPEKNISLGGSLIKELMDKYENQFILAVASYNASESAIRGWVNSRLRQDPIEFIEDIPYEETRNYVKLVLRNFILYSRLSTDEAEISFPEWCLENLHRFKS